MQVSVAEAKNKLPELIKAVEEGKQVTIARRGVPVVDMLRDADLSPIAVTITAGDAVTLRPETGEWHVPKRDLVGALCWLFLKLAQEGELRQQLLESGLDPRSVKRAVRYGRGKELSGLR